MSKSKMAQHLVTTVSGFWKAWIDATINKRETWDRCLKHYLQNYIDEADYKDYPWRCKVTRPVTQEVVDTISAAIKNALFPSNDDYFAVKGDDPIGRQFEKEVQVYLRQRLFLSRFVSRMEPFIKQICVTGNATGGVYNRRERVGRRRWQDYRVHPASIAFIDIPRFEHEDIFSVAFDPSLEEYDQGTARIRRTLVDIADLRSMSHLYNKAALNRISDTVRPANDVTDSHKTTRRTRFGINEQAGMKKGKVELLSYFGDMRMGGEMLRDQLVVIANRQEAIRAEPLPYFCGNTGVFAKYASVPGEMFGRGVVEPIMGLQQLIDTFSCQKADLINLILGGFWAVNPDALLDVNSTMMRPQGMFLMDDVQQIKSLVPTSQPTLAFAEIKDLKEETERSSGASKFAQGVVSQGRRTATEASITGQGTNNRFTDITVAIGEQAIEPTLNMFLQTDFQFNAYKGHPFTGEEMLPSRAWDGRYYVEFNGARQSALRAVAMQGLANFMDIIGRNEVFAQRVNPDGLLSELAKLMNINSQAIINPRAPLAGAGLGGQQNIQAPEKGPGSDLVLQ
jgi:hypothetical protein